METHHQESWFVICIDHLPNLSEEWIHDRWVEWLSCCMEMNSSGTVKHLHSPFRESRRPRSSCWDCYRRSWSVWRRNPVQRWGMAIGGFLSADPDSEKFVSRRMVGRTYGWSLLHCFRSSANLALQEDNDQNNREVRISSFSYDLE
jgi:hypothetical protein